MSETVKHTPTPWATNGKRVENRDEHGIVNDGWIICDCDGPDAEANAALIVRALNSHEALIEALEAQEIWEADVILNADWRSGRAHLSQDQHDALSKVQDLRNAALSLAKGEAKETGE